MLVLVLIVGLVRCSQQQRPSTILKNGDECHLPADSSFLR